MRIAKSVAAPRSLALLSIVVAASAALLWACGGSSSDGSNNLPPGYYITISGLRFSPLDLVVPPGATVTVLNKDNMEHSVTSEASASAFTPGAVAGVSFDTGVFVGQKSFTISASAPEGTVIPYYCRNHLSTMATPNGTITIHAGTQPTQPSGGGGGGGGY
jgi:plastocyanin